MNKFNQNLQFWILLAVLLIGGAAINWFDRRENVSVARRELKELSSDIGGWQQFGTDIRFSPQTESVLRADDYITRDYQKDGRRANVYVGYYNSQGSGATYHSPLNCLPGAGWTMVEPQLTEIGLKDGKSFLANKYVIQNEQNRQFLIYWYQGRGRFTSSEYRDKFNTIWDSMTIGRSDGAMVRVISPIGKDEAEALNSAIDFARNLSEDLSPYVPE